MILSPASKLPVIHDHAVKPFSAPLFFLMEFLIRCSSAAAVAVAVMLTQPSQTGERSWRIWKHCIWSGAVVGARRTYSDSYITLFSVGCLSRPAATTAESKWNPFSVADLVRRWMAVAAWLVAMDTKPKHDYQVCAQPGRDGRVELPSKNDTHLIKKHHSYKRAIQKAWIRFGFSHRRTHEHTHSRWDWLCEDKKCVHHHR